MRGIVAVTLTGLMLAACSGKDDGTGSNNTARPQADAVQPAAPSPSAASPAAQGNLTGQVSSLSSAVSGLNVRVTDTATIVDLPADTLFAFDKADLTPDAKGQLGKAAELIRAAPPGAIRVVGHTDSKGDDAYNQRLSEARARAVADWFGQQVGVRQRPFDVVGMGEGAPIAPNETADGKDDPIGRAKNRRVELIIPKL
jgi:outer membrane protein OmpA-like peptidoglycan-associated protein